MNYISTDIVCGRVNPVVDSNVSNQDAIVRASALSNDNVSTENVLHQLVHNIRVSTLGEVILCGQELVDRGLRYAIPAELFTHNHIFKASKDLAQCREKFMSLLHMQLIDCNDDGSILSILLKSSGTSPEDVRSALQAGAAAPILRGEPLTRLAGNTVLHMLVALRRHTLLDTLLQYLQSSSSFNDTTFYKSFQDFIDTAGLHGQTPLLFACAKLDSQCCEVLLAAGASQGRRDRLGRNALQCAESALRTSEYDAPQAKAFNRERFNQVVAALTPARSHSGELFAGDDPSSSAASGAMKSANSYNDLPTAGLDSSGCDLLLSPVCTTPQLPLECIEGAMPTQLHLSSHMSTSTIRVSPTHSSRAGMGRETCNRGDTDSFLTP